MSESFDPAPCVWCGHPESEHGPPGASPHATNPKWRLCPGTTGAFYTSSYRALNPDRWNVPFVHLRAEFEFLLLNNPVVRACCEQTRYGKTVQASLADAVVTLANENHDLRRQVVELLQKEKKHGV